MASTTKHTEEGNPRRPGTGSIADIISGIGEE